MLTAGKKGKEMYKFILLLLSCSLATGVAIAADENKYLNMSLEDLLSVEVSSVSRKDEQLRRAGAAVFVITAEDIRRSGVTNIPDALRMAPGINVGRINSNEWAVSARGFNGRYSNKLLVQIDGRTVFSPAFSGVYWDVQDTLIEDIDHIEVIRGPGATLWGSNAVNGIINIITKHSLDTQGGLVVAGAGGVETGFTALRFGGEINERTTGRVFVKAHNYGQMLDNQTGEKAGDDWKSQRAGFRVDSELNANETLTVQGDIYRNQENQFVAQLMQLAPPYVGSVADEVAASGWNTLVRWEQNNDDNNNLSLQLYLDNAKRNEAFVGHEYDTFDIDFQHRFQASDNQEIIWGLGFRHMQEKVTNTFAMALFAPSSTSNLTSIFVQDDIQLGSDDLHLVAGSKFEHNDYTGWEIQPNLRLTWAADERQTLWGAVSRAVHTPSRAAVYGKAVVEVVPPLPPFIPTAVPVYALGNTAFEAESVITSELGYRAQMSETLNVDVATFYSSYDKLRSFELNSPTPSLTTSLQVVNKIKGYSYGGEVAADWQAQQWWQWRLAYSYLQINLHGDDLSSVITAARSSPNHQVSLRSSMSLFNNVELDIWGRYNSALDHKNADTVVAGTLPPKAYSELDMRLAWNPSDDIQIALIGQNLLHKQHLEFIQEASVQFIRPTAVGRCYHAKVTVQF